MQTDPTNEPAQKQTNHHSVTTGALLATWRTMKRLFILLIGLTVLLIGVLMVLTPGPAILVIPLGLAILGIEFAWARRWLVKFKSYLPKKKARAVEQAAILPLGALPTQESSPLMPQSSSGESVSSANPAAQH